MEEAIMRFSSNLQEGDLVFFYYSGHANQQTIDQKTDNYLYGIDAKKETKGGVDVTRGVALHRKILSWFNEVCRYLIVLDACRIYPNNREKFKAGQSGQSHVPVTCEMTLAQPSFPDKIAQREYDVVYACQPGFGAIEDEDREAGFLATAFKSALCKSCSWTEALPEVIKSVQKDTQFRQNPNISLNIGEKIYFNCCDAENSLSFGNFASSSSQSRANPMNSEELPMPQNISQARCCDENLELVSVNKLDKSVRRGEAHNQLVIVDRRYLNIQIEQIWNYGHITSLHLNQVKILSTNSTSCSYLNIVLKSFQHVQIEDCVFKGIGLICQNGKNIILERVQVYCAPSNGIYLVRFDSVKMEEITVKDCRYCGILINTTDQAVVKKVNIIECQNGMQLKNCRNVDVQNVDVEECSLFAFQFEKSDGEIKNCRYKKCQNGVFKKGKCQIKSENVREICL
eukprot:TRINITY_DN7783_c0_g1_i2.p1 TRINITY_DN7783_c0_g1~~TRINITY_DN7783_c0_g1_i2.p1  ORF type:complete len:456 (+),score=35.13 TRINITY_DN7783_c0_g1_i2:279-1646(+)